MLAPVTPAAAASFLDVIGVIGVIVVVLDVKPLGQLVGLATATSFSFKKGSSPGTMPSVRPAREFGAVRLGAGGTGTKGFSGSS